MVHASSWVVMWANEWWVSTCLVLGTLKTLFNPQNNLYKEDVTIITFIIIPTQSLESKTQDIMSGPFWLCTLGA